MSKNIVIIAAGGDGERMKNKINKIFIPLLGKPVIIHTIELFETIDFVKDIFVTVGKKYLKDLKTLIAAGGFKKVARLIPSAKSRQESTWKVLKKLKKLGLSSASIIGVHNAVNPLVTKEEVIQVFKAAARYQAALLAVTAKDTVKISNKKDFVKNTPHRDLIWHAQTPQAARFSLLYKAFYKASVSGDWGTDDTTLVERLQKGVKIVPCSWENIKITYPADVVLAEEILKRRG